MLSTTCLPGTAETSSGECIPSICARAQNGECPGNYFRVSDYCVSPWLAAGAAGVTVLILWFIFK